MKVGIVCHVDNSGLDSDTLGWMRLVDIAQHLDQRGLHLDLVISEKPTNSEEESAEPRSYIDADNRPIFVEAGLGGKEYGSFRRRASGSLERVKSSKMPMVESRDEAQRNLDKWAQAHKLLEVPDEISD